MHPAAPLGIIVALAAVAPASAAAKDPFCTALDALIGEAALRAQPVRISVLSEDAMAIECRRETDDAVQGAYCAAAYDSIGPEMLHRYPWNVETCLASEGVKPAVELKSEGTMLRRQTLWGQKPLEKMVHLSARLRGGLELDLRFTSDNPYADHWFGSYDLVIWKPAA